MPFTPCYAATMQTLATVTLRSEPTSLSSTCPLSPSSWRPCISSTTSLVRGTYSTCYPLILLQLSASSRFSSFIFSTTAPENAFLISLQTPRLLGSAMPQPTLTMLTQTAATLSVSLLPWRSLAPLCRMPKPTHLLCPQW